MCVCVCVFFFTSIRGHYLFLLLQASVKSCQPQYLFAGAVASSSASFPQQSLQCQIPQSEALDLIQPGMGQTRLELKRLKQIDQRSLFGIFKHVYTFRARTLEHV